MVIGMETTSQTQGDGDSMLTPLHQRHLDLGAKCADFGGWDMPIEYSGSVAEHEAVRKRVGVFDVSHMGKLRIEGPGAANALNAIVTSDLSKITAGEAQYSMLCNSHGGVIDDFIIYRRSDDDIFMIPNAANADSVFAELKKALPNNITIANQHHDFGILAIQGPRSGEVLERLGLSTDLHYMSWMDAILFDQSVVVCRTGYTGELGFELVVPSAILGHVWDATLEAVGACEGLPAGLGARDILRTEMGYPLHGQDLGPDISPIEALLSWSVGWDKPKFAGRESLIATRERGVRRKRVALTALGRGIPRAHMGVFADSGLERPVGEITSGTFSPTLKQGIALALIDTDSLTPETTRFFVDIRGKGVEFARSTLPFIPASPKD